VVCGGQVNGEKATLNANIVQLKAKLTAKIEMSDFEERHAEIVANNFARTCRILFSIFKGVWRCKSTKPENCIFTTIHSDSFCIRRLADVQ
jgi:hypothetical protein